MTPTSLSIRVNKPRSGQKLTAPPLPRAITLFAASLIGSALKGNPCPTCLAPSEVAGVYEGNGLRLSLNVSVEWNEERS